MDRKTFRTLARGWEAYGHVDSLFGVLSDRSKLGGKWDEEEFFRTGRDHVTNLMRVLAENGVAPRRGACLDFGCGVGRLTQPLADQFETVVGVDVAASMIAQARRFNRAASRCRYVLNREPDLRRFEDASFDVVHSCITLQHMPPDLSAGYIAEFFRIARPDGLVVFQMPAEPRPEELSAGAFALPDSGYVAAIELIDPLPSFHTGVRSEIRIAVTNRGEATWRADIPTRLAGRIRVANHWLAPDGSTLINDDGRAELPWTIGPGERVVVTMTITPPGYIGECVLEIDLVQELVTWFASKGSPTLRVPAVITARASSDGEASDTRSPVTPDRNGPPRPAAPAPSSVLASPGWLDRIIGRLRRSQTGPPRFEMHAIPVSEVTRIVENSGGDVLRAIEDEAAGVHWQSFTYICRARERS